MRGCFAALAVMIAASPIAAADLCHQIEATEGWQTQAFPNGLVQDVRSSGFWSIAPNLAEAGTQGHGGLGHGGLDAKTLEARPENRPVVAAGHGALLVRFEIAGQMRVMPWAQFHGAIQQSGVFNMNLAEIAFRINEADDDLADNSGALTLCFRYVD